MKKPLALTLLLAGLPVILLIPGVVKLVGGAGVYRPIVLWGLPVSAALVAAALTTGRRRGFLFGGSPATLLRLAPWCVTALVVDYSFLGIGHLLGFITFTYGDQGLSGHPFRAMAWGLPLCLGLGVFGWEWTLRRTLYVSWIGHVARPAALLISCAVGVALMAPSITPGLEIPDGSYVAASFLAVACRELSFGLIFASGAGLPAAGLYRGLIIYMEAFLIADWYSVFFPMANFTTSEPAFYLVRGATAILAAGVIVTGLRWNARRQATAGAPARAGASPAAPAPS
ncbi:MAG: hypothetical protein DMF52_06395 [Acidobacteria bacterium]|nr:MAG: hypothetical protein DMF52_06395 [Acidobacteriota bacterium]